MVAANAKIGSLRSSQIEYSLSRIFSEIDSINVSPSLLIHLQLCKNDLIQEPILCYCKFGLTQINSFFIINLKILSSNNDNTPIHKDDK